MGPAGFYIAADAAQYVPASCHGIGPIGTTIDPSAPAGESGVNWGTVQVPLTAVKVPPVAA